MDEATQTRITIVPGRQFYQAARAGFVSIGTSLTGWSRDMGYRHQNVRAACFGSWEGPKAKAIRQEILHALSERGVVL